MEGDEGRRWRRERENTSVNLRDPVYHLAYIRWRWRREERGDGGGMWRGGGRRMNGGYRSRMNSGLSMVWIMEAGGWCIMDEDGKLRLEMEERDGGGI